MKYPKNEFGFSALVVIAVIVLIVGLTLGAYYVWDNNKEDKNNSSKTSSTSQNSNSEDKSGNENPDPTESWTRVTTSEGGLSMKVPDGWKMTVYPDDYIGTLDVVYDAGKPATVQTSETAYMGHSLRFRASINATDDAGLGPQWASPQPGLSESSQAFSIGALEGKRFKGVFSGDLNQTLYEYVFNLGNDKKLDVVYTVYHNEDEPDVVNIVEQAIKTITLN